MTLAPHYLCFARAIALLSVAAAPGCYSVHERSVDGAGGGLVADAAFSRADCICGIDGVHPQCVSIGHDECCIARAGPLAPPDLPA